MLQVSTDSAQPSRGKQPQSQSTESVDQAPSAVHAVAVKPSQRMLPAAHSPVHSLSIQVWLWQVSSASQ
jgi:hypothetical protein